MAAEVKYETFDDVKDARRQVLRGQLSAVERDHLTQRTAIDSQRDAPGTSAEALEDSERALDALAHRIAYYQSELKQLDS